MAARLRPSQPWMSESVRDPDPAGEVHLPAGFDLTSDEVTFFIESHRRSGALMAQLVSELDPGDEPAVVFSAWPEHLGV